MNLGFYVLATVFATLILVDTAGAVEPILITISSDMSKVVFDGRWTDELEWKKSSWDQIYLDNESVIHLRTAHQENFIYIHVNVPSDTQPNKGADKAIVCFDTKNDKSPVPDTNDYCFQSTLGLNVGSALQGGSLLGLNNNFKKIPNPEGFVAVGSLSDKNDRYSKIPHASYEFRIPTDFVGRSDIYGFYLVVYDANDNNLYSWPTDVSTDGTLPVPNPPEWGEIISPDKSLPEYEWPIFLLLPSLLLVIYLTKCSRSRL